MEKGLRMLPARRTLMYTSGAERRPSREALSACGGGLGNSDPKQRVSSQVGETSHSACGFRAREQREAGVFGFSLPLLFHVAWNQVEVGERGWSDWDWDGDSRPTGMGDHCGVVASGIRNAQPPTRTAGDKDRDRHET